MSSAPNFEKELEAMKQEIHQITAQANELLNSSRRAFDQLTADIAPKIDEAAKAIGQGQKSVESLTSEHPFAALAAAFAFGAIVGLSFRK